MSDSAIDRPGILLGDVVLDTDDLARLAEFYSQLLGWPITVRNENWWTVQSEGGGTRLSFQLATNYRPPTWPANEVPQQSHLDLDVSRADLPAAVAYAQSLGAVVVDDSASHASFVVLLDPSGHPFCLCAC